MVVFGGYFNRSISSSSSQVPPHKAAYKLAALSAYMQGGVRHSKQLGECRRQAEASSPSALQHQIYFQQMEMKISTLQKLQDADIAFDVELGRFQDAADQ